MKNVFKSAFLHEKMCLKAHSSMKNVFKSAFLHEKCV